MKLSSALGLLRDLLIATALAFLLWFAWIMLVAPSPMSSGPVPSFELSTLTGEPVRSADFQGTVVLNFWFTSCPPCRHEIPELVRFHDEHPDVGLYGISIDQMPTSRLAALSKRLEIDYPVLHDLDKRVSGSMGVSLFPTTIVLKDGEIVATRMGEVTAASLAKMIQ